MRLSEGTIRDVLRSEAARVKVPDDMWQHLSRELQRERAASRRRPFPGRDHLYSAVAVAALAGLLWFATVPPSAGLEVPEPAASQHDPDRAAASLRTGGSRISRAWRDADMESRHMPKKPVEQQGTQLTSAMGIRID
jgi:hypothetical protein